MLATFFDYIAMGLLLGGLPVATAVGVFSFFRLNLKFPRRLAVAVLYFLAVLSFSYLLFLQISFRDGLSTGTVPSEGTALLSRVAPGFAIAVLIGGFFASIGYPRS